MRFADYEPGDFFDEMFDASRQAREPARALAQFVETLPEGELLRRQRSAERALLNLGITFGVYGDTAGQRADLSLRSRPADRGGAGMEPHRARPEAAHPRAQPLHRRHLPRSVHPQGRRRAGRDRPLGVDVSRSLRRPQPAARHLVPHHRHGSGARQGRLHLRPRRQPALPVRRVVRPPEPADHQADLPAALRSLPDPSGRRLRQPPPRHARVAVPRRRGDAAGRGPDAGAVQLRLLRAFVPGAADGRRAGRGTRSRRLGRLRVDADDEGLRARRRDLPAHGRRLHRSGGVPVRLGAGRARAVRRLQERTRRPGQRAGHRHRRRQSDLRLRAADREVLPGRGRHPAERAHVPVRLRRAAPARAGEPRVAGGESGQRVGRLRHARRTGVDARGAGGIRPAHRGGAAQLHRAADAVALAGADHRRRRVPGTARGSAPVHPLRRGHLRPAGRADPRRAAAGIPRGQFLTGRRQQGHLGPRRGQRAGGSAGRRARSRRPDREPQSQNQGQGESGGAQPPC